MKTNLVLILSGPIAAGKTSVAEKVAPHLCLTHLRTSALLKAEAKSRAVDLPDTREALQGYGMELDKLTSYGWLANRVSGAVMDNPYGVIVDSVRSVEQIQVIRKWQDLNVVHVHLEASTDFLIERYLKRGGTSKDEYLDAMGSEPLPYTLARVADLVLNVERMTTLDVGRLILGLLGESPPSGKVDAIIGGQYGSEGKGHVVSYLASEYDVMVRVGGPNAGHTVLHPVSGDPISFYHIPSGALHNSGSMLLLGPGAVIRVPTLEGEIEKSGIDPGRIVIDPQAAIITQDDIEAEKALVKSIGSTGQGVGQATARKVLRPSGDGLARSAEAVLKAMGCKVQSTVQVLNKAMRAGASILLEGTQGTGLSLHHGEYPYVTSRDTTVGGTAAEAGIAPSLIDRVYMVCRTNPIRVQSPVDSTSGPMSLETTWEAVAARAGIPADTLRKREMTTTTKRQRRVSEFDWELLYRSSCLNRPTDIALTFADYIAYENRQAFRYDQLTEETRWFIENVERVSGARVSLITTKFEKRSIIDRRVT